MQRLSIIIGILLILVTVYVIVAGTAGYITAFFPAVTGIVLIALAMVSQGRDGMRRQTTQAATLVAALAAIGSLRVFTTIGNPSEPQAEVIAQIVTLVLALIVLIPGVQNLTSSQRSRAS